MHPDLAEMAEEFSPFMSDNLFSMVTVLDEEDLKRSDQYSEESIADVYRASRETLDRASPKIRERKSKDSASADSSSQDEQIEKTKEAILDKESSYMSDNQASNNWVVHGNFTESGMPFLANDPHLQTSIPAVWLQ